VKFCQGPDPYGFDSRQVPILTLCAFLHSFALVRWFVEDLHSVPCVFAFTCACSKAPPILLAAFPTAGLELLGRVSSFMHYTLRIHFVL